MARKKINLSDDEIRDIITPELDRAKEWGTQLSDERKRCRELYDMAPLGNEVEGFSQNVDSTVFEVVEWLKPGLNEIYCHDDFFEIKMDNSDESELLRNILRHQLFEQQEGEIVITDYVDDGLKYHNTVLKCCYVEESDDIEEEYERLTMEEAQILEQQGVTFTKYDEVSGVDPLSFQPVTWLENVKGVRKEIKFRGPKVMAVPSWEFFITPGSRSIDTARIVAHRVRKTLHDIKLGEQQGVYRKGSYAKLRDRDGETIETPEHLDEVSSVYEQDGLEVDEYVTHDSDSDHEAAKAARTVYVWEIYTRLDIDADGLLEPVIVRMAEGEVLQIEENPYKRPPFRAGSIIRIAHRFEGRALPIVLENEVKELTNLSRLFVDSAAEAAYATAISNDPGFLRQWADRSIGDGLFCQGDPKSKVAFERSPGPDQNILAAIEMKDGKVERKSGVSRYNQGLDSDSLNKTARGISIISSLSQQKQKFGAKQLGWPLRDILKDMIAINAMWPPYIEDQDLQPTEGLFKSRYSIRIEVGVGPQDRAAQSGYLIEHQKWLTAYGIPSGVAKPEHSVKTQAKIGKLQGVPFDGLMMSEEEVAQAQGMQQQIAQLQQQMQQMAQQIEQAGQFIQKLQQENQSLQQKAQANGPEQKMMDLQADMQVERAKIEKDIQVAREKLAADMQMEREKLAADILLARERMMMDAQNKPAPTQEQ